MIQTQFAHTIQMPDEWEHMWTKASTCTDC